MQVHTHDCHIKVSKICDNSVLYHRSQTHVTGIGDLSHDLYYARAYRVYDVKSSTQTSSCFRRDGKKASLSAWTHTLRAKSKVYCLCRRVFVITNAVLFTITCQQVLPVCFFCLRCQHFVFLLLCVPLFSPDMPIRP